MIERAEIVSCARALIGTPYRAKARLPGPNGGTDCIGLPIMVSWETGGKPRTFDIQGYSMQPDGTMLSVCREHLIEIGRAEMGLGDLPVLRYGKEPHHVGIVGDYRHGGFSIIHAENYRYHRVVEHRLWLGDGDPMQFVTAFRMPGVAP